MAAANDIKTVAKLPINPEAARMVDAGEADKLDTTGLDEIFKAITQEN